ncbi:hypothetical protein Clacol_004904 [Clathrus columnatus]|uniref:F-box domain-containing protein n=1 Tax=Clathrus columnatus TaxID=1419009 RepID=A0AAV5AAR5_9AGAM|nr:hypothetical protein Clacol_004904 [Clathrus columnatus]
MGSDGRARVLLALGVPHRQAMLRSGARRQSPPPSKNRLPSKGHRREVSIPSTTTTTARNGNVNNIPSDTKDPFTAMSLLRKLLNNTARQGYKISQEDHKLSLRLLSIIEPFISPHPVDEDEARRSLTRQPNEILDMIVFHLDSRKDLLSLALTCQRLRDIVLPRHLEYRFIQCKPNSEKVWKHLIAHPLLACNVRRLHVIDERSKEPELIPNRVVVEETDTCNRDIAIDSYVIQQRLIIEALTRMTTLSTFSWSCNTSLISFDDVSPTLFTCEMLKEVDITDNRAFSPCPTPTNRFEEETYEGTTTASTRNDVIQTPDVPDLTSVAVRTARGTSRLSKHPSLEKIQTLLISHCPNLTTLRIGYDHRRPFIPRADDFFTLGRWPNLRTLSLQNLWCSTQNGFEAATNFLAAHSSLEYLQFELGRIQLDLPANSLPKLRELTCSRDVAVCILSCPRDNETIRPLESIKGLKLGGGRDEALLRNITKYATSVKRIELAAYNEVEDVKKLAESAPKLSWLDVGKKSSNLTKPNAPASVNEWAIVLSSLPELTILHGVHFFYEFSDVSSHSDRSRIKKNDEVASMLAWKSPKLKRVDYSDGSGKVVILGKDGDRSRWEVKRLKL